MLPLTLLLFACSLGDAANILVLLPLPGYSHTMPFVPILKELGRRNHSVTFISPFELTPNPQGFRQIKVNSSIQELTEVIAKATGAPMTLKGLDWARNPVLQLLGLWTICPTLTPYILERTIPHLPPAGTKFDLVVTEPFFCMEPLLAASALYNAPIVVTLPGPLSPVLAEATGNPLATSYVPNWKISLGREMGFLARTWNTIANTVELLGNHLYHVPRQDRLMREMLGDLPPLEDLHLNISLVLTETHFTLLHPRPFLRNIVEVGGISVNIAKPLPKELEKTMDESKDGVIYFSWGSHFDASDADEVISVMMKTFSTLKQKVLFKWKRPVANVPKNVIVQSWFPQPSILAHKNTVLFISHGGLNSMYESAHYGVPVLATPIFGDHFSNMQILKDLGMSLSVPLTQLEDGVTFSKQLNTMLADPSFKKNAVKASARLRDRPLGIIEEAVYWMEYVMRHGSEHLEPATRRMPWYSRAELDVWVFLVAALVVPPVLLLWAVMGCCCSRKKVVVERKKKRQ